MPNSAWNNWYHIMFSTYGQWLPGDDRSWRTRHHRDHIEGDYKNPVYTRRADGLYGASRMRMPHPPVILLPEERGIVGRLLIESLKIQQIEVLSLTVTIAHVHFVARCPKGNPRDIAGKAKHHATVGFRRHVHEKYGGPGKSIKNPALTPECPWRAEEGRKLWGLRGHEKKIADRAHHIRAFRYVLKHVREDGWIWDFKSGERRNRR